jgi:23S rRNA (uracil-5-)-methyltransferase RumA
MQVTIEKIVYPGKSLAVFQGKVCLTDEGLPGEIVDIRPVKEKKNYIEARTIGIIKASEERMASRCPHYKACSSYQVLPYPRQIEIKKAQVLEILSSQLDLAGATLETVSSPRIWHYRNKVRLHILREGAKAELAYNAPGKQDEFVKIQECFLISEPIGRLLADLKKILDERAMPFLEEVEVRESRARGELLLNVFWKTRPKTDEIDPLITGLTSGHRLAGIVCLYRTKTGYQETSAWGKNYIEEEIERTRFHIGAQSFFQVNVDLLPRVTRDIMDMAEFGAEDCIADFYCGLGTFGIALAPNVKRVYGIESGAQNIEFLKRNLALNQVRNFTICEGPGEEWISWVLDRKMDAVLFDPPRKGLGPAILQGLRQRPAPKLIYLSCNPTTLARDLKELETDYKVKALKIYDFFPHTPHIETLAILEKTGSNLNIQQNFDEKIRL